MKSCNSIGCEEDAIISMDQQILTNSEYFKGFLDFLETTYDLTNLSYQRRKNMNFHCSYIMDYAQKLEKLIIVLRQLTEENRPHFNLSSTTGLWGCLHEGLFTAFNYEEKFPVAMYSNCTEFGHSEYAAEMIYCSQAAIVDQMKELQLHHTFSILSDFFSKDNNICVFNNYHFSVLVQNNNLFEELKMLKSILATKFMKIFIENEHLQFNDEAENGIESVHSSPETNQEITEIYKELEEEYANIESANLMIELSKAKIGLANSKIDLLMKALKELK
jgi:hypothetical protein